MANLTWFITKDKLSKAQQIILPKYSKAVLWMSFSSTVRRVDNSPKFILLTHITPMCTCFIKTFCNILALLDVCNRLNLYLFPSLRKQTTLAAILEYILNRYIKLIHCSFITCGHRCWPLGLTWGLKKIIIYWTNWLGLNCMEMSIQIEEDVRFSTCIFCQE